MDPRILNEVTGKMLSHVHFTTFHASHFKMHTSYGLTDYIYTCKFQSRVEYDKACEQQTMSLKFFLYKVNQIWCPEVYEN